MMSFGGETLVSYNKEELQKGEAKASLLKYPAYKDSGVEWIGEIPEHWEVRKLKYISKIKTGYTPDTAMINTSTKDGIIWVKPDNLKEFDLVYNSKEKICLKGIKKQNIIPKGSLLVNCIGTIGKFGIAGVDLITNQQINAVTFGERIASNFGKYLIFASNSEHNRYANGNVVQILNTSAQGAIRLPTPPKQEQTLIANYLDKKIAQIDKAISLKEQMIKLLKERRQVLINEAVTKGLDKNGKLRIDNGEFKESGVEWIGRIPKHWNVVKGKRLFRQMKRGVRNKDEIVTCFRDGEVTLRKNRRTDGFTNALKEHGYQGIRKGDLVIHNMDAFAGAIGISDSDGKSTPVYSVCIPRNKDTTLPAYYAYYLRHLAVQGFILSLAKGIRERSTDFRFKDFGELLFPVPPKEEQEEIMSYVSKITKKTGQAISIYQKQIEKLKEYKATLIDSCVTGKVRVEI